MLAFEEVGGSVFRAKSVKVFALREIMRVVSPSHEKKTRKIIDTGRVRTHRLSAIIQWHRRVMVLVTFRMAFKFDRRVLRRKMLKLPIVRLPAILLDVINRGTDCIYEAHVNSTRP